MDLDTKQSEEHARLVDPLCLGKLAAKNLVEDAYALPLSARQAALDLRISGNQQAACLEELDFISAGDAPDRPRGQRCRV
jgi:hypothetical protein